MIRLSTLVTPGADQAARSASFLSSDERTLPLRSRRPHWPPPLLAWHRPRTPHESVGGVLMRVKVVSHRYLRYVEELLTQIEDDKHLVAD